MQIYVYVFICICESVYIRVPYADMYVYMYNMYMNGNICVSAYIHACNMYVTLCGVVGCKIDSSVDLDV